MMTTATASTAIPKSELLDMLEKLPDPVAVDELLYRIYLRERWALGEQAIAEGRVLTTDQVRARIAEWRR